MGLDFDHGVGHGVGHFLCVHEEPHRIEQRANPYPLTEGMVVTVEPGYYRSGEFGIRIENQVAIAAASGGFLGFESLTLAPIDLSPADPDQIDAADIAYIDAYHQHVREMLVDDVEPEYREFLFAATRPSLEQFQALGK